MGCGNGKLSKYLTQTFTAHCNAMICQQVTLSGDAEWPKVADAVIEADNAVRQETSTFSPELLLVFGLETEFAEVGIRNGAAELVVTLAAIQRTLDVLPQGR